MCLVLLAINQHPDYPLIITANRDEFYLRKSRALTWWPEGILAGQDLQAGGTWMALDKQGFFAVVTNFRESPAQVSEKSRGELVLNWLKQSEKTAFIEQLKPQEYAGFNLIFGNLKNIELFHLNNRQAPLTQLSSGIYGLSNASLNSHWPKVDSAKALIRTLCQKPFIYDDWFDLLADNTKAHDALLPDTGVGLEAERLLSSRFIQSEDYGTRCSSIITLDRESQLCFIERRFNHLGQFIGQSQFDLA